MAKKAAKSTDDKKDPVFDVSKPGKGEAQASSRPIIVTRKPIVQDPMVRDGADVDDVPGPPALTEKQSRFRSLKRSTKINITPEGELKNDPTEETPQPETKEKKLDVTEAKPEGSGEKPDKKATEGETEQEEKPSNSSLPAAVKEVIEPDAIDNKPPVEAKPEKVVEPDVSEEEVEEKSDSESDKTEEDSDEKPDTKEGDDEKSADEDSDTDKEETEDGEESKSQAVETSGIVDELAKQAANKKSKEKEEKEIEVNNKKVQKLVAEKTYFLPVGQVTRRKKNRNAGVALLLVILLALVAANFAMDAGILNAPDPIKPLTDLIPN